MNPVSKHRDTSRRARACAMALALLLVSSAAAAAEDFKIGGTGAALGTMHLLAEAFTAANPDIRITTVPSLGSGGSIKAVAAGAIGLAVTSRPMNESERKLGAVETEYARTPFLFAVSTKSKVTAITSRELADIYAGKKVTWADGSVVRIVLRPASDIDTELVKNISPAIRQGIAAAEARPGVQFSVNDQDAAAEFARPDRVREARAQGSEARRQRPHAGECGLRGLPVLQALVPCDRGKALGGR